MIRNNEAPVRAFRVPQNNVASALAIYLVTQAFEGANCLCPRNNGELAQTATSTTSSSIGGGIGSS